MRSDRAGVKEKGGGFVLNEEEQGMVGAYVPERMWVRRRLLMSLASRLGGKSSEGKRGERW